MTNWTDTDILALITFIAVQAGMILAVVHAILNKRDPRSSIGWAGLIILVPGVGAILYWLLGINRVRRKAQKFYHLQADGHEGMTPARELLERTKRNDLPHNLERLLLLTDTVAQKSVSFGNRITPLVNGEETYPEMLNAIKKAQKTIALSTYIFDNDRIGKHFAAELIAAGKRGVLVRALVDDIGARYSFPTIMKRLKGENIKARKFHRTFWPWRYHYAQLRNHRKLLLVDGAIGFIGGINIRDDHMISSARPRERTQDLHFKVEGPVLNDFYRVFSKDWRLAAKEELEHSLWLGKTFHAGNALTRIIPNGPDEDFDKLRWTMLGAIASAESTISIVTPYFLPDQALITALGVACMRGTRVEIVIPEKNNHKLVHWACIANIWQLLERGCEVYLSRAPFDHSKMFVVDGQWALIGSSNWDARSFRLNFELNLECYDQDFVQDLERLFLQKKELAKKLSMEDLNRRPYLIKVRDALARLLTPYL